MSNVFQCKHLLKIFKNKRLYSDDHIVPIPIPSGEIYDKKPIKVFLKAGISYWWCTCARSKKEPFCDGTHENPKLKIPQKPLKFQVKESKEYNLCLCKHTSQQPFCDGTHKEEKIQRATSVVEKIEEQKKKKSKKNQKKTKK